MEHDLWTYSPSAVRESVRDIDLTGFEVESRDGSIGKIAEATYQVGASYMVVDTGPWIFGKKVIVPAGKIHRIDVERERVFVDLMKDEIKNAPEFDEDIFFSDEQRTRLGDYYGRESPGPPTTPYPGGERDRSGE